LDRNQIGVNATFCCPALYKKCGNTVRAVNSTQTKLTEIDFLPHSKSPTERSELRSSTRGWPDQLENGQWKKWLERRIPYFKKMAWIRGGSTCH
jgi:hypothetical protein